MHSTTGSPTEPSFTSKHAEKSEQHEKIEKAKLASTTRSRSSQPSLLPPDLPPALTAQLVTVTSTRDLLSAHIASNDRRLRRLLCRYTNQIQHGCKNLYCTVPSCLTCRARNGKTPLRKYTDATARALAAHILEEQGEKGLCHSDPVVPWFETPGSRPRTCSTEVKPKANGHARESANGHAVAPTNGHVVQPNYRSPSMSSSKALERRQSSDLAKAEEHTIRVPKPSTEQHMTTWTGTAAFEPSPVEESPTPLLKKDTKSFSQAVFDSLRLRSLWTTPPPQMAPTAPQPVLPSEEDDSEPPHQIMGTLSHDVQFAEDCSFELAPGHSTSAAHTKMHNNEDDAAEDTVNNRKKPVCPKLSDDEARKHGPTEPPMEPPRTPSLKTHSDAEGAARKGTRLLVSETLLLDAPTINESQIKTHSAEEGDGLKGEGEEPQVQVVPLLSFRLLDTFKEWKLRTLDDSQMHWADQRLPEPYLGFVYSTMFFCLRDSARILRSLNSWHDAARTSLIYDSNGFDGPAVRQAILKIARHTIPINESFRALRLGLADAYNSPPDWRTAATSKRIRKEYRAHRDDDDFEDSTVRCEHDNYLSDEDTARLCAFGLLFLEGGISALKSVRSSSEENSTFCLEFYQLCNHFNKVFPEHRLLVLKEPGLLEALHGPAAPSYREFVAYTTELIDYFDDYDAKRLFARITEVIAIRHAFGDMRVSRRKVSLEDKSKGTLGVAALTADYVASYSRQTQGPESIWNAVISTIEWTKLLFARDWDGNAVIRKASSLGGSLQLLMAIFVKSREYAFAPKQFHLNVLAERLNMVEMPAEWLSFRANNKNVHLLSYPFLFEPHVLVCCFRAINYSRMSKAAIDARAVQKDVRDFTDSGRWPGATTSNPLLASLRPYMVNNFVITIRRRNLLEDAMDQIWRRQRREFLRPLKVRMGMDEGEQGVDLGGVQQEFFRLLFAQALDITYGMFTIDERTRMTWFKPGSLEPLYKFEVLGVFMSLAVYNSITLPITFPLAFYRKLLGLKVKKVHQIADGWPELATGLQQMLSWSEGDVSDVFARTYEFSYEAFGKYVSIPMKKFDKHTPWPPGKRRKGKEKAKTTSFELPPDAELKQTSDCGKPTLSNAIVEVDTTADEEAALVTNADREQYVKDYIVWLTHRSIEQQYKAFASGFYACLDRTALSIFTPEALKSVVEGYVEVDIQGLEAVTKYEDGFDPFHTTIQDFWQVVRNFSTDQHRRLLEFVTASDRVPVNGIRSVHFIIQRNGSGDERLPTSMTCFGRLLLPEYSSRTMLEEKLTKAIENSEGFGVA